MNEAVWNSIARLCARPLVTQWLVLLSMRNPFLHLGGYMRRWWLMPPSLMKVDSDGYPEPKSWVPVAFRIHHILREDWDAALHGHPFDFRTIILSGWYVEEDVWGRKHARMAGSTRRLSHETLHRIDSVSPGGVWTLVIMGRKRKDSWGFMDGSPARLVHHSRYRSPNNRTAQEEDAVA